MNYTLKLILVCLFMSFYSCSTAQELKDQTVDTLPYHTIPDYPDSHSAASVLARTIDGLGFRYYWATEGLRTEDLAYNPGNESRTSDEVLDHLYGLADMICNTVIGEPNIRPREEVTFTPKERRAATLFKIKKAADYLRAHSDLDLESRPLLFQRGEKTSEVPFWHLLNGPLADALWHCGQIVSSRRASGNPIPAGVNVFMGTKN